MRFRRSAQGNLPNLIVIGAQKCATSSLHYYLGLHPQIRMSRVKELNFFAATHNWSRGIDWYKSNFRGHATIFGESSPAYTNYPFESGVAERMASVVPDARLIYLVRDPIERIVSHYVHMYARNSEDRSIDEALGSLDGNHYLNRSRYFLQLNQYIDRFPRERILILSAEALGSQRESTLRRVFAFLGVDDRYRSRRFLVLQHRSRHKRRKTRVGCLIERSVGARLERFLSHRARRHARRLLYWPFSRPVARPVLHDDLRRKLRAALADDVSRLRAYTGESFADWSV
jgi:hypothetical protein